MFKVVFMKILVCPGNQVRSSVINIRSMTFL